MLSMTRKEFAEVLIKQTLDNKEKVIWTFKGDKEQIINWLGCSLKVMEKKMSEGFEVPLNLYLMDFYTMKFISGNMNIINFFIEIFDSHPDTKYIRRYLNTLENEELKNKLINLTNERLKED